MGNRATVIFWNGEREPERQRISPAVYLHWNGGPESVYAFLAELEHRDVRADQDYECARFMQLVGEFFDYAGTETRPAEGLSLGVANGPTAIFPSHLELVQTDHGDNGFYVVDRTASATEHAFAFGAGEASCEYGWVRRFTERSYKADDEKWGGDGAEYLDGYSYSERYDLCEWKPDAVRIERERAEEDAVYHGLGEFYNGLEATLLSESKRGR